MAESLASTPNQIEMAPHAYIIELDLFTTNFNSVELCFRRDTYEEEEGEDEEHHPYSFGWEIAHNSAHF